ncbi:hypothetical protein [Leptodesmis sichuanensis]|uniref:hypothetical protein n=1 Tax=Leptodesmis sichuanensis TaxID=2906798 RepID=UPI001F3A1F03|nr:hypothetical protein [Leptodesmis sichuanensis]UIE36752.1 hypothetical protein KIK02_17215 [Leptodesmis sichuanensis A121]
MGSREWKFDGLSFDSRDRPLHNEETIYSVIFDAYTAQCSGWFIQWPALKGFFTGYFFG